MYLLFVSFALVIGIAVLVFNQLDLETEVLKSKSQQVVIEQEDVWLRVQYENHFVGIDCEKVPTTYAPLPGNDYGANWQSKCWSERIWFENRPEWCQNIYDIRHCYSWMAIKTGDISLCDLAVGKGSTTFEKSILPSEKEADAWKYECVNTVAARWDKPELCNTIPFLNSANKDACVRNATDGHLLDDIFTQSPI